MSFWSNCSNNQWISLTDFKIFLTKLQNSRGLEEGDHILERLVVSHEGLSVSDDDQFSLGSGDGHVESPGVEEDVAGADLLDVAVVTAGAAVEDDELVPALVLVHSAHLHLRVLGLQISLESVEKY